MDKPGCYVPFWIPQQGVPGGYYWGEGKMGVILEGMKLGRSPQQACFVSKLWSFLTVRSISVPLIVVGAEDFYIQYYPFCFFVYLP